MIQAIRAAVSMPDLLRWLKQTPGRPPLDSSCQVAAPSGRTQTCPDRPGRRVAAWLRDHPGGGRHRTACAALRGGGLRGGGLRSGVAGAKRGPFVPLWGILGGVVVGPLVGDLRG